MLGRYALFDEIASGGMAAVHYARLMGSVGFTRTVAIKRLHPQLACDPEFVDMFLDEARLAARIRHPNVVPTLDIVSEGDELFLVMEYVLGETLSKLHKAAKKRGEVFEPSVSVALAVNLLDGLHAAHEARSETGEPLEIVHRDVSPQNLIVGADGVARVLDFGVAKAAGRIQVTRDGALKGKLAYMAPEQLERGGFDRRVDIFAAGVVLWELLTGRRLFDGGSDAVVFGQVLGLDVQPPSHVRAGVPAALDEVVMRSLARSPDDRFSTAHEMATELERALPGARPREVAALVQRLAGDALDKRAEVLGRIESYVSPPVSMPGQRGLAFDPFDEAPTALLAPPQARQVVGAASDDGLRGDLSWGDPQTLAELPPSMRTAQASADASRGGAQNEPSWIDRGGLVVPPSSKPTAARMAPWATPGEAGGDGGEAAPGSGSSRKSERPASLRAPPLKFTEPDEAPRWRVGVWVGLVAVLAVGVGVATQVGRDGLRSLVGAGPGRAPSGQASVAGERPEAGPTLTAVASASATASARGEASTRAPGSEKAMSPAVASAKASAAAGASGAPSAPGVAPRPMASATPPTP